MSIEAVMGRISAIESTIASLGGSAASGVLGSTALATSASSSAGSAGTTASTGALGSTGALAQDVATRFATALSAVSGTSAAAGAGAASAVAAGTTTAGATGADLVTSARKYLGVPYVWGGESADGVDCSGLVQLALQDLGVEVPRTAREQMTQGTAVASLDDALPGDLVVFDGGSHIGIYLGDGRMIDAPKPGKVVVERDVYETPTAIRRVLPTSSSMADLVGTADIQRLALEMLAGSAS